MILCADFKKNKSPFRFMRNVMEIHIIVINIIMIIVIAGQLAASAWPKGWATP